MVYGGDRRDDREAEAEAVAGGAALQSLEGLEEDAEVVPGDDGTGVGDDEGGLSVHGGGREPEVTAGDVVPGGVVDEVRDEAFQEYRFAGCHRGLQ